MARYFYYSDIHSFLFESVEGIFGKLSMNDEYDTAATQKFAWEQEITIMKLCVLANLYGSKPLDEALSILKGMGVEAVEIGCGGYPGTSHGRHSPRPRRAAAWSKAARRPASLPADAGFLSCRLFRRRLSRRHFRRG